VKIGAVWTRRCSPDLTRIDGGAQAIRRSKAPNGWRANKSETRMAKDETSPKSEVRRSGFCKDAGSSGLSMPRSGAEKVSCIYRREGCTVEIGVADVSVWLLTI
jgi:hypothetical protein